MKTPEGYSQFTIIEEGTDQVLATLPTTIPIGSTVEGFERAGYKVRWTWTKEDN
jgi:hypothetical protein